MCTYRDNAMDRAGELQPDFRTAVEIEWSKDMEHNKDQSGAEACSHTEAVTQYTGDGRPVSFCPDCGRNEPMGGAAVRGEAVAHPAFYRDILYTDIIQGEQVRRDDLWAITTMELNALLSARAADAPSEPSEPPRLDTEESREYLVTFMERHFTDTTFHRYIRGQIGGSGPLAGDFAWQMARALRRIEAGVVESRAADALDSQPTDGGVRNG